MPDYHIAWWNLENLFDSVRSDVRPEWLEKELKNELKGWTTTVLDKKVAQLSSIINAMNGTEGPDILGVCEVENRPVLDRLVQRLNGHRHYAVAHADTSDNRGIDVAFIYDADLFTAREQFSHVVLKRNATRDIFQVNFESAAGNTLICIGNHWPARSAGELPSRPYRQMAGETLAYWMERIRDIQGRDAPVVVVGDFNDEPFDSSMTHYALAERTQRRVISTRTRNAYLLNLMWPLMGQGEGTHYFDDWGMLDQILVNRGLLTGNGSFRLIPDSVSILSSPELLLNDRPRRFGRPSSKSSPLDEDGYSDHLPVACRIREET